MELDRLQKRTLSANFWDDRTEAKKVTQEINNLKETLNSFIHLEEKIENAKLALEILSSEEDAKLKEELKENLDDIEDLLDALEEKAILGGKYDYYPAVITIHPGAGGTESADWAEMLFKMYTRWMDRRNFKYKVVDYQAGEEAGIVLSPKLDFKIGDAIIAYKIQE